MEDGCTALRGPQRGKWSDLKIVTGVKWVKEDRENVVGLFEWKQNILGELQRNRMRGTLTDKQERMVAYLFETVLGLCIASSMNISSTNYRSTSQWLTNTPCLW